MHYYYSLFVAETGETHSGVVAPNRQAAIVKFGRKLGKCLTLDEQDVVPPYLLGEGDGAGYRVPNPDIPVYDAQD